MPLYDYRCKQCNHVVEVRHGFGEAHSEPCPVCGGALQRVFNPAPIVFKGSGFYVTDSRKSSAPEKAPEPAKAESGSKPEGRPKTESGSKTETSSSSSAAAKSEKPKPKKGEGAGEPAA
jgi:putative FmdB family regulatory protein